MADQNEVQFSVMDHLSEWLMRPRLGDDKPPSFWPSSAAALDKDGNLHGMCRRQQFLTYLRMIVHYSKRANGQYVFWEDLVEDLEGNLVPEGKYQHWVWEQGELFETHVLDLIKESGLYLGTQIQVYIPEYNVSGKIDAIAFNPYTRKKVICEVKSVYGFNADKVLGTNWERRNGQAGEPRDRNLMQLAIYQWHYASDDYDYAQLIYGDRGTGKYAVYQVDVDKKTGEIRHRSINPGLSQWTVVPYTIWDILKNYKEQQQNIDSGTLPERDFSLRYSHEEIEKFSNESYFIVELDDEDKETDKKYPTIQEFIDAAEGRKSRKFLCKPKGKTKIPRDTAEQYIKHIDRVKNGGRQVKEPEDGDYQCGYCSFKNFCYNANGTPRK